MINNQNQNETMDFLNGVARKLFYKVLEREMREYVDKNKDRIIAETILMISKEMSFERIGPIIRFEIKTDSK